MSSPSRRRTLPLSGRVFRGVRRRGGVVVRFLRRHEIPWFTFLVLICLASTIFLLSVARTWPLTMFLVPIVLGSTVLSLRRLWMLVIIDIACVIVMCALTFVTVGRLLSLAALALCAAFVLYGARGRYRLLGVESGRSDSMLIDLRDRLVKQSRLPVLPPGWSAEAVMKSAGGASFAGDFLVAARTHDGGVLEVIVADVSGKGLEAGTRSLMLSSAFGGLLGSLPPEELLPAANEYLLRQSWLEEFVTAIHLSVDLATGVFEVRTAGHPPAVQFKAGSGRWVVHWTEGPILGLIPAADYPPYIGRLNPGDALMIYTDGLVETPTRDMQNGIDKLVGEAERLVRDGVRANASRLVSRVESDGDDRALVMLVRQ